MIVTLMIGQFISYINNNGNDRTQMTALMMATLLIGAFMIILMIDVPLSSWL